MIIAIDDDDASNELVTTFYKALCISFHSFINVLLFPIAFVATYTSANELHRIYVTKTFNETFSKSQKEAD
jgi:hypothetical protein